MDGSWPQAGGDVLWYYVPGFGLAWRCQSAIASAWLYLAEKQRTHSDQVGESPFMVGLIGLVSPLPLFAQVVIERLNADDGLRTEAMLDELLQRYAAFYRMTVDIETCAAAHHISARRFWNFQASAGL